MLSAVDYLMTPQINLVLVRVLTPRLGTTGVKNQNESGTYRNALSFTVFYLCRQFIVRCEGKCQDFYLKIGGVFVVYLNV